MRKPASAPRSRWSRLGTAAGLTAVVVIGLTACGSSSKKTVASSSTTTTGSPATGGSSASPGTMFSAASVSGLGTVLVDGAGKTVYVLSSAGHKNLSCDDASGCTKVWPDLPFPNGLTAATAGSGIQASLLGSMKEADGQTYPTYNGWLMYEYTGDTGPAQGHGEGIQSFNGTWYALSPSGNPVTGAAAGTATTGSYGY